MQHEHRYEPAQLTLVVRFKRIEKVPQNHSSNYRVVHQVMVQEIVQQHCEPKKHIDTHHS